MRWRVLLLFVSCQKEVSKPSEENFDAAFVKEWYYGTFKKSPEWAGSDLRGKKLPDWGKPETGKFGNFEVIEYPLGKGIKAIPVESNGSMSEFDRKRIADASLSRIMFIKKKDKIIVREVEYVPSLEYLALKNYDISKVSVLDPEQDFSGLVVIKEWGGSFVSKVFYEKGKIVKSSAGNKSATINNSSARGNSVEVVECTTTRFCIWQKDCEIIFNGDQITEICGEWYNTGVCWDEEFCYETDPCILYGIGCEEEGGDEPEPCNMDCSEAESLVMGIIRSS